MWRSPPATTRRATTATRCTWATAPRSSRPPTAGIAAEIDAIAALADVPRPDGGWLTLDDSVLEAYLARTDAVLSPGSPRTARTVYTAMHGVGKDVLLAAFARAGFPAPVLVAEQAEPDPLFPTVAFPNPEEPGAMDLAFARARRPTRTW